MYTKFFADGREQPAIVLLYTLSRATLCRASERRHHEWGILLAGAVSALQRRCAKR